MSVRVGAAAGLVGLVACSSSPPPRVLISEIHYHPVAEDDYVERHELVEIYNAGDAAVELGGWRLVGDTVAFELPDVDLEPGAYQVIARDRAALAAVWGLDPAVILGDYTGELDNGRDTVRLLDASGDELDRVTYRDEFPWPVGADALGAGDKWLAPELLPAEAHRYRGYSLERVSFELPSADAATWAPSRLDGSTPGLPNTAAASVAPAIALARSLGPSPDGTQLSAIVELSAGGPIGGVELEWFVDDVAADGEPITATAMTEAAPRQYTAAIPAVGDGVVVRYRVTGDRGAGAGREVISPRPTDPYRWHAYASTPPVAGAGPSYQLYVAPSAWGQMWNNVAGGQGDGCALNAMWDAEVPAVLLYEGGVYDVLARYQGSRYNRTNGRSIPSWPYPGPTAGPNPPLVLSWHLSFPRYHKLDGKGDIILGKNSQGCPGIDAGVGFALFRANGLPASEANYARLYVNGGYYHYMLELERPGDEMMAKYGDVGDLFKSVGSVEDNPIGWGDERLLGEVCGFTAAERYTLTYDRKTHTGWGRQDELIRLITDLNAARDAGIDALRAFFAERFDVDALLTEMAIMNWAVPFDDMFQNHFLYLRRDGRWMAMPWDLDLDFGGWKGASASLWIGEQGDPDNRDGWWNVLKDGFIKSYRAELGARMRQLVDTTLAPEAVGPMIDAWVAGVDADASNSAPAGPACDFASRAASWRQFVVDRQAVVRAAVP